MCRREAGCPRTTTGCGRACGGVRGVEHGHLPPHGVGWDIPLVGSPRRCNSGCRNTRSASGPYAFRRTDLVEYPFRMKGQHDGKGALKHGMLQLWRRWQGADVQHTSRCCGQTWLLQGANNREPRAGPTGVNITMSRERWKTYLGE